MLLNIMLIRAMFNSFLDDVLIPAIIFSNIYALASIGLTMTYITTKIPSFAHGDLAAVGAYAAFYLSYFLYGSIIPGSVYVAMPAAALAGAAVAYLSYIGVFRPMIRRNASITTLMIASFGLHFVIFGILAIIDSAVQTAYGWTTRNFLLSTGQIHLPGLTLNDVIALTSTIFLAAILAALYWLLNKTKFGVIMRASIDNAPLAKAMGIEVERVYAISWLIIGAITGIAGVFMGMIFPVTEELGWLRLPIIFIAVVVGGLSNIYGSVIGSYIVGFSMVLGFNYILSPLNLPPEYELAIPFAIVIAVLLLAPQGIAGLIAGARRRT
ncbi:branched-chain amino acid transport permease protein [Thermoproteus tenax Kra 1]|uniref:Branched-chain amino acid transport permease protein n=2 Tax=Thermoproteus tenax TaxID=2271 RepID=G4RJN6_THETK|nr:branched-chain amino acid transport permease protein [Thermoproteus tenax Kra 1]